MTNAAPQVKKPTAAIKKASAAKAQNIPAVKAETKPAGTKPPKVSRTPATTSTKEAKAPKPVVEKGPTKREMAIEIIRDYFSGTLTSDGKPEALPKEELFEHIVRELQLDKGPQPEKALTNAKGHFYFIKRNDLHLPLFTGAKKKARLETLFGATKEAESEAQEEAKAMTEEVQATVEAQADQPVSEVPAAPTE